ncbi:hypothetical protein WA026_006991 [Henosepilachna vigintioctopunctata]|uniref:PH domain-containing protein n=1 Tax=Henosepilachna vigintioctopunctata TaxID=420089 RepID=A0AAW1V1P5_9CUCU
MKVQACEINVNQLDNTRMDLVIPGEQHMYLRAATSQERQQWLVALGTSKACVRNRKDIVELNPDALKTKKSELRLYCDLLMQQVHMIKTASKNENGSQIQEMDEATKMLGATCDTFIKTLEECMKLTSANIVFDPPISSDIIFPPNNINSTVKKEVWTVHCEEEEYFDQNSMIVSPLTSEADFIITGSHKGVLRIFKPVLEIEEGVLQTGFKANDLILEQLFDAEILQLGVGKLVSGSSLNHLAILHPKLVAVYSMVVKEGATDHGVQYLLKLMYSHALKRSSANFTIGRFGGTLNRDFICVQSLDGLLTIFEQESYGFSCTMNVFLLPGPLVYVRKTDSFVTTGSNWFVQCFKYKNLYDAGHRTPDEDSSEAKSILSDWDFQLNEPALDLNVLELPEREFIILILGERNLYGLNSGGRLKFMKRLEYSPLCFSSYMLDSNVMNIVVSETGTALIYQNTTLKWSAKLNFLPVNIKRANLWNLKGCLVMLSEEGRLECCYLGTEPSLFVAPPLSYQDLNFEEAEKELTLLSKITKNLDNDETKLNGGTYEKQFVFNVKIDTELSTCIHEHNLRVALNHQMCSLTIDIIPREHLEELQITILVQRPLKCIPDSFFFYSLSERTQCRCDIFLNEDLDVPTLRCEVVATFVSDTGVPRNLTRYAMLPLALAMKFCQPQKESGIKINLNLNRDAVPVAVLFPGLMQDNPLEATGNSTGFTNVTECSQNVSVLLAKSSQRYRVQSDSLESLNLMLEQILYQLRKHFQDDEGFSITFSGSLPFSPLIVCVNRHFQLRKEAVSLQEALSVLSSQYRLIEKRLVAKLKAKTPAPLKNLGILLENTFVEIMTVAERLKEKTEELNKAKTYLECSLNAVLSLMKIMNLDKKLIPLVESAFQPFVHDVDAQSWDDVIDGNMQYLLRTCLAKSEKDRLRAQSTSFEQVKDISKVEKHLTQVLERLSKKIPLDIAHQSEEQGSENGTETQNEPIGISIGKASSRVLSARVRNSIARIPESKAEGNEEV